MGKDNGDNKRDGMTRRDFVKMSTTVAAALGGAAALTLPSRADAADAQTAPASKKFLVVDQKKCAGCMSCMLACSMAHEGSSNLSSARIQIIDDAFAEFPNDVEIAVCRQCADPACYYACPLKDKALCIDPKTGVRYINKKECIGCKKCIEACHFTPSRISFNLKYKVALKCDMCQDTPFWKQTGKQACVEVCPQNAIKFTSEQPSGHKEYNVNMRGEGWAKLGLPTD